MRLASHTISSPPAGWNGSLHFRKRWRALSCAVKSPGTQVWMRSGGHGSATCDPLLQKRLPSSGQFLGFSLSERPHWLAGHAVQSNTVSNSFLQKSATLPKIRRDFRHTCTKNIRIGYPEILHLTQEARQRRASCPCCPGNLERVDWLAGAPGFEPGDGGIKIHCLTTWLRPNAADHSGAALPDQRPQSAIPSMFSEPSRPALTCGGPRLD